MNKFYGQFDPPVDKFIFERYFPDTGIKGVFVECGAFDGLTECSCKFFEETMGWTGYNLEPVPWVFEKLCKNRPNGRNLNFALSSSVGSSIFKAVRHPVFGIECTNGSLQHTAKHKQWLEDAGCSFENVEVRLLTWKELIEREQITHVDLFVLDVEGHELSVLAGMEGCTVLPAVICVEVGHLDFEKIRSELGKLGYIYDISSHVNAFYIRHDLLPLFALRSASTSLHFRHTGEIVTAVPVAKSAVKVDAIDSSESLTAVNELLRRRVKELTELHQEIVASKGWRLVEFIRGLKN